MSQSQTLHAISNMGVTSASAAPGDAAMAAAKTQVAIQKKGVTSADVEKAPADSGLAAAQTQIAIQKQGVKSVDTAAAPTDVNKARNMTLAAIGMGKGKSADPSKAPSTAPTKESLAEIQKDAQEEKKMIQAGEEKAKSTLDLKAIGSASLKKTEGPGEADTSDINRTVMMREINRQGIVAMPSENKKTDVGLAQARTHAAVNRQGVIAMPSENAPKDAGLAQALTQLSIQKQGVKAVNPANAPVEAGKARMMTLATIESSGVKSVNSDKAPSTAPKAELLADIQKEAGEEKKKIEEGEKNAKANLDLGAISKASLKKTDGPSTASTDANLQKTMMLRSLNDGVGGSVPEGKDKVSPALVQGIVNHSIKTQGVIAMPSEKAPVDVALSQALTLSTIAKQGVKSVDPSKVSSGLDDAKLKELLVQKEEELKESK